MFIQKQYRVDEPGRQLELVKKYPLGTIITNGANGLVANHIPFLVDTDSEGNMIRLRAHFARINEQQADFRSVDEVLVIFKAEDAYITPNWYKETKPKTGKVVPTWDFACVHIKGKPTVIEDDEFIINQMRELTDKHEDGRVKPWTVDEPPEKYFQLLRKAVYGLTIDITSVEGKWKMSQDKPAGDVQGVKDGFVDEMGEKGKALRQSLEECL